MKEQKKRGKLPVLLLLGTLLMLACCCTVQAKTVSWTRRSMFNWLADGKDEYRIADTNTLCKTTSDGKTTTLATWKLKEGETAYIPHAYKNKLYVSIQPDPSREKAGPLYAVDIKTGKKTKVLASCFVMVSEGKYVYGGKKMPGEPAPNPQPVYKWTISGNKLKPAGKLGNRIKDIIYTIHEKKNKMYYSSFSETADGNTQMAVYQSYISGSGRKKLFTIDLGTGGNGSLWDVSSTAVLAEAYIRQDDGQTVRYSYSYDLKTGKLTKTEQ